MVSCAYVIGSLVAREGYLIESQLVKWVRLASIPFGMVRLGNNLFRFRTQHRAKFTLNG